MYKNGTPIRALCLRSWRRARVCIAAGAAIAALTVAVPYSWAILCPPHYTNPSDTSTTTTTVTTTSQTTTTSSDSGGPGDTNPGTGGGEGGNPNSPEPATVLSGIIGAALSGFYVLRRRRGGKVAD